MGNTVNNVSNTEIKIKLHNQIRR